MGNHCDYVSLLLLEFKIRMYSSRPAFLELKQVTSISDELLSFSGLKPCANPVNKLIVL